MSIAVDIKCTVRIGRVLLAGWACTATALFGQEPRAPLEFFRDVQPILVKNCITCHGPSKQESRFRIDRIAPLFQGGNSGQPAVVGGDPAASQLLQRILSRRAEVRMPPEGSRLDAAEVERIRAWVQAGAIVLDSQRRTNPHTDHWAFQPVRSPRLPKRGPQRRGWEQNEVDRFVGHRLRRSGLQASTPADRNTLIRRVYLVMIGLPPTPQQVRTFVTDGRPDAYARLVDQVLASPHYGERWAQHWLDCVRYAETTGYEVNGPNGTIYPYRDYVIGALNADKPYDRFLIEQLAGDHFSIDAATGFLVAGPHDVNLSPDPRLTAMQYQDGLDEIIKSTSAVMLGITLGCARCHDHKYDPLSQRDYYAMQAVFAGTGYGTRRERGIDNDRMQRQADQLEPAVTALRAKLQALQTDSHLEPPVDFHEYQERISPVTTAGIQLRINSTNSQGPVELDDIEVWTVPEEGTPSVNVAHRDRGARATSSPTAKANQGKSADLLLDGTRQLHLFFRSVDKQDVWIKIFWPRPARVDRIVIKPRGSHVPVDYRIDVAAGGDTWTEVVDSRDRFLHRQDLRPVEAVVFNGVDARTTETIVETNRQLREIESRHAVLRAGPQVFAGRFSKPRQTHLMVRGDPQVRGPRVDPAIPAVLGQSEMDEGTPGPQRRLHLAQAIAARDNPLTARVIANRLWQYLFGVGLVDTPSDLGINGGRPTHPELLDWLASDLMRKGWSLKALHRKLLRSGTFRQASLPRLDAIEVDADCRLVWRFPPRRLEAEAIRDSILAASGRLNRRMSGPSFPFFEKASNAFQKKQPRVVFDDDGWRRMIYGRKVRLEFVGVFGVFDCPDASQMVPARSRSTTAGQALSLLNSPFVLRQAEFLAAEIGATGLGVTEGIERAVRRTLCRAPSDVEREVLHAVAVEHGLAQVCRILLNLNEFVFIN